MKRKPLWLHQKWSLPPNISLQSCVSGDLLEELLVVEEAPEHSHPSGSHSSGQAPTLMGPSMYPHNARRPAASVAKRHRSPRTSLHTIPVSSSHPVAPFSAQASASPSCTRKVCTVQLLSLPFMLALSFNNSCS